MDARPKVTTDEMLAYLDNLREGGFVNMFGATPYLVSNFKLTWRQATEVLVYWMTSYQEERDAISEKYA